MNVPPKGNAAFRLGAYFETLKVSQQPVPNLTVRIAEGAFWAGGTTLVEFSGGNTAVMVAPGAGLAVWVLVALTANGSVQLVYGVPAATNSPPAPAVPAGYIPLAFVYLTNGMTAVTNDMIFDERPLWVMQTSFVPLAGATMTGPLILNANPTAAMGAATKQYVDTQDALHPTFTDLNNGLLSKADIAGTPSDTFVLNSDWVGAPSTNVFFGVDRGSQPNTYIRWNEGTDLWELTNDGSVYSQIITSSAIGAYLPLTGGTLTGPLLLASDPIANLQAATKQYVDATVTGIDASTFVAKAGSTMTGVLVHPLGTAVAPSVTFGADLTTGFYAAGAGEVDVAIAGVKKVSFTAAGVTVFSGFFTPGTGGVGAPEHTFTNDPTTGMYRVGAGAVGFAAAGVHAATFSATGLAVTGNVSATGGLSVTGPATMALDMGSFKVVNMAGPTVASDAANKSYVDTAIAAIGTTYVDVTGDTMTGSLTMSGAGVQVVLPNAPTLGTHAANKTYVDSADALKVNKADTFALTGDVTVAPTALTGPANSFATTLATSGVTAASYGSASAVAVVTFDAKGRATTAATTPILITEAQVTGLAADLTARVLRTDTFALTGDVTASGSLTGPANSYAATLANTTVIAASYGSVSAVGTFTVDAKGRLTAAANATIAIDETALTFGSFTNGDVITANASGHPVDSGTLLSALALSANVVPNTRNVNTTAGDLTGGGALSSDLTLSLATTAVIAASYGSVSQVGTFTVDTKGRLTAAANATIAISGAAVTVAAFTSGHVLTADASGHVVDGGTLLSALALDASVVHLAGTENITGSKTVKNTFFVQGDGTNPSLQVSTANNVAVGLTAPATGATDGFPYIPVMAGTPTGVPTGVVGFVPMVFDSVAMKIWIYTGGAWHFAALT